MDSDLQPPERRVKSFRAALDDRSGKATPTIAEPAETFRTPEEVAAADGSIDAPLETDANQPAPPATPPPAPSSSWREKLNLHWPPGRKEYITALVLIIALGVGGFLLFGGSSEKPKATPTVAEKAGAPAGPKTVASKLSGLQVDPSLNQRPVTGVMIENSLDARPQSGLSEAGVVFEAIAEGGITRFLALYQDTAPGDVGPVRSARPYYVLWNMGFDAGYAHVGGSPEALAMIKSRGIKDLDQFGNSGSYHRVGHRTAPHNVYTAISTLHQLEDAKGYKTSTFDGFARKAPTKPAKKTSKKTAAAAPAPNSAKSIDLRISSAQFNVHYDYDAAANNYHRSLGGAGHTDANGNQLIKPVVVIAMVVPYSIHSDGKHSVYGVVGSGSVVIFQDGTVTVGTWTKASETAQITFADAAGQPILLNPGQTWVTAVADAGRITSSP